MSLLLAILAGACVLVGAALVAIGLRGRRIDEHPICRGCRFDLVGVYPVAERCPECGRELGARRAVRTGARRRRRGLLIAAGPLLALGLGGGGLLGWATATSFNWYRVYPDWLLESIAESGSPARQGGSVGELAVRLSARELGADRADRLIGLALKIQADAARPWRTEWGDLIDAAAGREMLTPTQIESYLANACQFGLEARRRVIAGEEMMVQGWIEPRRVGGSTDLVFAYTVREPTLDGEAFGSRGIDIGGLMRAYSRGPDGRTATSRPYTFDVEPGEYELAATFDVQIGLGGPAALAAPMLPEEVGAAFTRRVSCPVEVFQPGTRLVELVVAPELRAQIGAAIEAEGFRVVPGAGGLMLDGSLYGRSVPIDCVFEVWVRSGGREQRWGIAVFPRGGDYGVNSSAPIEGPVGDTIDLVLRASEEVVRKHSDLRSAWAGEIVIERIPVSRAGGPPGVVPIVEAAPGAQPDG